MRPVYIRREPFAYYVLRQLWHNERLKDWIALAAVGIWLGTLPFVGATT